MEIGASSKSVFLKKEKLTLKQISKDVLSEKRGKLIGGTVLLICVLCILMLFFIFPFSREFLFSKDNAIYLLALVFIALVCVGILCYNASVFYTIKKQKFRVATVTLNKVCQVDTVPPTPVWAAMNGVTNYKLIFSSYGEYVTRPMKYYKWSSVHSMDQKALNNYSIAGDEFYVAVVKGRIEAVYNTKLFDLQK